MKKFNPEWQAVIMCGISGSGKTHFAHQLEKEGYSRLSTDSLIWEKVGSKLSALTRNEQKKLFAECGKEMRSQLLDFLKSGKKVVVDATHCKRFKRDEIRGICKVAGVSHVFVYCDADEEELKNRLRKRKGLGPDDLIVTPEEFAEYWLGFERPQDDETDIVSDKTFN